MAKSLKGLKEVNGRAPDKEEAAKSRLLEEAPAEAVEKQPAKAKHK